MSESGGAWRDSANWGAPDQQKVRVGPMRTTTSQSHGRRLEAPFYYAANAQILISGNDASLLFTRPHPAVLPDGNLASAPLREPVALVAMSVATLKELSKAVADVIRRTEERNQETEASLLAADGAVTGEAE